jgi:hypothetical protein
MTPDGVALGAEFLMDARAAVAATARRVRRLDMDGEALILPLPGRARAGPATRRTPRD